jgi:hypothetical protein
VNVVYLTSYPQTLYLDNGASDVLLATLPAGGDVLPHRLNAGWTAYSTNDTPVTLRSPGGAIRPVTPETTWTFLEALGSDGTLIFRYPALSSRYYLVTPGGARLDVGPSAAGRIVERDGAFLLITGLQVYRLAP